MTLQGWGRGSEPQTPPARFPSVSAVTHTQLESPRLSNRRLAEYMAASPVRQRTLIRDTKYRSVEPEISYSEGFTLLGDMLAEGDLVTATLREAAEDFHDRMDVRGIRERIGYNLTGDMFDWLADERPDMGLPEADHYDDSRSWGRGGAWEVEGVVVDPEVYFRLARPRRGYRSVGAVTLRYSKTGPLDPTVAEWQSALLHGYLSDTIEGDTLRPDTDLCVTLDLRSGTAHPAPGRARTLMTQMRAALATIAERWPNIAPPDGAVVGEPSDAPTPATEPVIPF